MNELTVVNQDGKLLVSSVEVAQMVEKEHKNLMRDIRIYSAVIEDSSTLSSSNFFIESTYLSPQNKNLPCYLLTKEGCDMVANKMIGAKGILFTATYVLKFKEMEATIASQTQVPMCIEDMMIHQLESMKEVRAELGSVNNRIELISEQLAGLQQVVYATEPTLEIGETVVPETNWYQLLDAGIFSLLNSQDYYLEGIGRKGRTRSVETATKLGYVRTVASGTAVFILPSVLRKGLARLNISLPLGYKYLVAANIVIPGASSITKVIKYRGSSERLLHFNLRLHPDIIAVS